MRGSGSTRRPSQPDLTYLGQDYAVSLKYEGGDPHRLTANRLPLLTSSVELADAIGISLEELAWLSFHKGVSTIDHYHRFSIPKRGGGVRSISSPKTRLRRAQRWLLRAILAQVPVHEAAMAFRPYRSIAHNAAIHQGQALVIRVDLKDFFPSVTFRRVRGLFAALGYNSGLATIMALLTTEAPRLPLRVGDQVRYVSIGERVLPQGACTSPAITNILCRRLDSRLSGLATRFGFHYTRYADDCVFSHHMAAVPLGRFQASLREIITDEDFVINEEKTRVMRAHQRQTVTGLVVNERPTISRTDLRRFRAFLHHCEMDGLAVQSAALGRDALAYARGYLAFIRMVVPDGAANIVRAHPWLQES